MMLALLLLRTHTGAHFGAEKPFKVKRVEVKRTNSSEFTDQGRRKSGCDYVLRANSLSSIEEKLLHVSNDEIAARKP
jgi:hypothetical protein